MCKEVLCCKSMKTKNLNDLIENLREILNEICSTIDVIENDNDNERLIVSRCLDELIVEYMRESVNIN